MRCRYSAVTELSDTGTDFNPKLNFIQGGLTNSWVVFQVLAELSSLLSADEAAHVLLDPEVGEALSPAQLDAVLSSLSTQALERIPQLITKVLSLIRKLDYFGQCCGSGFNLPGSVFGSGFAIRIRIQEGKNDPQT